MSAKDSPDVVLADMRRRAERIKYMVGEARHNVLLELDRDNPSAEDLLHIVTLLEEIDCDIGHVSAYLGRSHEPNGGSEIRQMATALSRSSGRAQ